MSVLQNNEPSDESRLRVLITTNFDFDISWLPQLRVSNLLSSHLAASNGQGEDILLIHLLMADLNPGPFSDLWQLGAIDSALNPILVVFIAKGMCQQNPREQEIDGNRCHLISHNYTEAHGIF